MQPRISIITVCRNAEAYIEDTIKSVLSQNYKNIEYIIIDGASTDNTLEIVLKYSDSIKCIISEPDLGISDAFNKGIQKANGELIGIINAGDLFYDENVLQSISNFYTPESEILQGNQLLRNFETGFEYILRPSSEYGHMYTLARFYPNHMSTYITKKIYDKYGGYDINYKICMDVELLYRFHRNNVKITKINQTIGVFRLGGISEKNEFLQMREKLRILKNDNGKLVEYIVFMLLSLLKILVRKIARHSCGIDAIREKYCRNLMNI